MTTRKTNRYSRRTFLAGAAASASAFAFHYVPRSAWGANDRIRVAGIGIGGKGAGDVTDVAEAGAEIVALCDVDDNRRSNEKNDPQRLFPKARFYRDFRVLLEKEEKNIDAVTVSTPDHTHCHAAVTAMRMGKHVYCQKPLTHSVWEARLMAETARQYNVATQMGNQAHAGEPIRRGVELIRAGLVGDVSEVHAWTNRPIWPQGMSEAPAAMPIPNGLDWDLWLGPAASRPYHEAYVPFRWRGWWDFGTGALGDMGCHILDMPYWALELGNPTRVEAESQGNTAIAGPHQSTVTYHFPAAGDRGPVKMVWYDGDRMPSDDILSGVNMPAEQIAKQFDLVIVGSKGRFFFQRGKTNWQTVPGTLLEDFTPPPKTLPRVANEDAEWMAACQGGPAALSNFDYSGPFTEVVLLGNLAIRLGQPIEWDAKALRATNAPAADELIRREYRKGWQLTRS